MEKSHIKIIGELRAIAKVSNTEERIMLLDSWLNRHVKTLGSSFCLCDLDRGNISRVQMAKNTSKNELMSKVDLIWEEEETYYYTRFKTELSIIS